MSSLVSIANSGKKGFSGEKKRELAAMAGIRFIKLRHKLRCKSYRSTLGFQSVIIRTHDTGGGKQIVANWSKNGYNNDCARGELTFYPNEFEQGEAYLPDSPFNRKKLAASFYNGLWTIVDERVIEEIKPLVDKFADEEKRIDLARRVEVIVREENMEVIEQNKFLIKELEKMKTKLEAKEFTPPAPRSNVDQPESVIDDEQKLIDREIYSKIKDKVKIDIYEELKDTVEEIKNSKIAVNGNDRGWAATEEYKKLIAPAIEKRTLATLELSNPEVFGRITHGNYPEYSSTDKG